AASELIRSFAEPILEQYRSVILSSLKFSKLTVGTVVAQFTRNHDGIENAMGWKVSYLMLKLELALDYLYRLIFKPLVDEFPYFGAVCYSLMEKVGTLYLCHSLNLLV
ncbi:hypothetical protein HYC85_010324, partial [Camellia sinensis]